MRRNLVMASATLHVMNWSDLVKRHAVPRESFRSRAFDGGARQDNRLALLDQAFFAGHRAAGQKEVMQAVWVYRHAVDFDALRRLHHTLGYALFGRCIERSPLPFGRHRWVADRGPSEIDIAACARPRAEISDWADELTQLPLDPERGPGWYLGVLPLTDGSTAVSMVVSHYLLDGIGSLVAMVNAILGNTRDVGYPPPRSRTRLRAVIEDARQTAQDAPEVGRALAAGVKIARRRRQDAPRSPASRPVARRGGDGDDHVVLPGITIHIDLADWDLRAETLGGASNTLVAGFTAKLGERLGFRHDDDGTVTVQLVASNRTDGDTRAVAVSFARVKVDASQVTVDLRYARDAIRQALNSLRETPDEAVLLAPLTPFTPKRAWKRLVDGALTDPDHPVFCSNFGDIGPLVTRLDGTDCEYFYARGINQRATRQWLEKTGGQLQLLSHRSPALSTFSMHVVAYQPGAENTKPALRQLAARTLAEFDLTGQIE
jgi:hypothetical protein